MTRKVVWLVPVAMVAIIAAGCGGESLSKEELKQYQAPNKIEKITSGKWVAAYERYLTLGTVAKGDGCGGSPTHGQEVAYRLTARSYNTALRLIDRQTATARPKSLPPEAPPLDWMRTQICQGVND